jgi:deoxyribose-phosphate aldolase
MDARSSSSSPHGDLASWIDHTLLKADTREEAVDTVCREAVTHGFAAVCIPPVHVARAARALTQTGVRVATVSGFPLGFSTARCKAFEAGVAVEHGADEIDMVMAVHALKDGRFDAVREDIAGVVQAAAGRTVKVILETCLLTHPEKETACRLAMDAGAHFVKTSTGLAGGGATVEDILLMRRMVGTALGVKASGGIRTAEDVRRMLAAGATRIGTSAGVAIVTAL